MLLLSRVARPRPLGFDSIYQILKYCVCKDIQKGISRDPFTVKKLNLCRRASSCCAQERHEAELSQIEKAALVQSPKHPNAGYFGFP